MTKIKFTIITLFEDAIRPYLETSMMWKAQEKGIAEFDFVNLRDFGLGPHKSVDDTPYGGGDGMLLRCEPVFAAIESVKAKDPSAKVILPTPAGETWTQELARELAGRLEISNGLDGVTRVGSLEAEPERGLIGERVAGPRTPVGIEPTCEGSVPVISLSPSAIKDSWSIEKTADDKFLVTGAKIEKFARRTDFSNYASVNRLRDIMKKMGIRAELTSKGAVDDSIISIAGHEFTLVEDW